MSSNPYSKGVVDSSKIPNLPDDMDHPVNLWDNLVDQEDFFQIYDEPGKNYAEWREHLDSELYGGHLVQREDLRSGFIKASSGSLDNLNDSQGKSMLPFLNVRLTYHPWDEVPPHGVEKLVADFSGAISEDTGEQGEYFSMWRSQVYWPDDLLPSNDEWRDYRYVVENLDELDFTMEESHWIIRPSRGIFPRAPIEDFVEEEPLKACWREWKDLKDFAEYREAFSEVDKRYYLDTEREEPNFEELEASIPERLNEYEDLFAGKPFEGDIWYGIAEGARERYNYFEELDATLGYYAELEPGVFYSEQDWLAVNNQVPTVDEFGDSIEDKPAVAEEPRKTVVAEYRERAARVAAVKQPTQARLFD